MKKITKKVYLNQNVRTLKNISKLNKIKGNIIEKKEGWLIVKIHGDPYERGYAHGYLLYKELIHVKKIFPFLIETQFKIDYATYVKDCKNIITPIIKNKYSEFYDELRGIINGCKKRDVL